MQVLPKAETPRSCPTKFVFKLTTKERESYFCLEYGSRVCTQPRARSARVVTLTPPLWCPCLFSSEKKLKSWAAFIRLAVDSTPSKVAKRRWALLARERGETVPGCFDTVLPALTRPVCRAVWLQQR